MKGNVYERGEEKIDLNTKTIIYMFYEYDCQCVS